MPFLRSAAAVFSLLAAVCLILPAAQAGHVEFRAGEQQTLEILILGQPFAVYHYGKDLPKPFLLHVRTPSGVVINRALHDPMDADHPHHKGLWVSIDEVNGQKFWAEKAPIVNVSVKPVAETDSSATLEVVNEWRHSETQAVVLTETTRITIHEDRVLVYDIRFTATSGEAVFEDTKEGLLGFRVHPSMKEKNGGQVVASDGSKGTKDCWGRAFPWIDYYGTVDERTVGVTLMDHPGNLRPSRYHVRDYGLFSISPFGEKAYTNGASPAQPLHLQQGSSVRLRYGVYIHDGDTAQAKVAEAYQKFLSLAETP